MRDIRAHPVQVHEIGDVHSHAVGASVATTALFWGFADESDGCGPSVCGSGSLTDGEVDQLAQDGEFELQLDGVYNTFDESLQNIQGSALDAQQAQVHDDNYHVDDDQLIHGALGVRLKGRAEDLDRLVDVDGR